MISPQHYIIEALETYTARVAEVDLPIEVVLVRLRLEEAHAEVELVRDADVLVRRDCARVRSRTGPASANQTYGRAGPWRTRTSRARQST
jgi:hypothetical protein